MENILFVDIETVPGVWNLEELPERTQHNFKKKFSREIESLAQTLVSSELGFVSGTTLPVTSGIKMGELEAAKQIWREQAALFAEFGKIICISTARVTNTTILKLVPGEEDLISVRSFASRNEEMLLRDLKNYIDKNLEMTLCAHNGKEFDFQYLSKRFLINGIQPPAQLRTEGLKPWEVQMIDTMELWKFGSYRASASLDQIADCFGLPSPKEGIDGSQVGRIYYEGINEISEHEDPALKKINVYCNGDVVTLANVYRCIKGILPIPTSRVHFL